MSTLIEDRGSAATTGAEGIFAEVLADSCASTACQSTAISLMSSELTRW